MDQPFLLNRSGVTDKRRKLVVVYQRSQNFSRDTVLVGRCRMITTTRPEICGQIKNKPSRRRSNPTSIPRKLASQYFETSRCFIEIQCKPECPSQYGHSNCTCRNVALTPGKTIPTHSRPEQQASHPPSQQSPR